MPSTESTESNRPNQIQYLFLSDIKDESDRHYVIHNLIGDYHVQRYWLQCASNFSNKILIGFYYIKNPIEFLLDTIVEINVNDVEKYLATTVVKLFKFLLSTSKLN